MKNTEIIKDTILGRDKVSVAEIQLKLKAGYYTVRKIFAELEKENLIKFDGGVNFRVIRMPERREPDKSDLFDDDLPLRRDTLLRPRNPFTIIPETSRRLKEREECVHDALQFDSSDEWIELNMSGRSEEDRVAVCKRGEKLIGDAISSIMLSAKTDVCVRMDLRATMQGYADDILYKAYQFAKYKLENARDDEFEEWKRKIAD